MGPLLSSVVDANNERRDIAALSINCFCLLIGTVTNIFLRLLNRPLKLIYCLRTMAFERRKKAVQDNLSGVIPKGSLTPGSEAWESHSRSLSPFMECSLSSWNQSFTEQEEASNLGGGTVKNSSSMLIPSSQFRDSGPMTVLGERAARACPQHMYHRIINWGPC